MGQIGNSEAENLIFSYLEKIINPDYYIVEMHSSLSSVLNIDQNVLIEKYRHFSLLFFDDVALQESNFMNNDLSITHFDFVIFTKDSHLPLLIIEVNGSTHLTETRKIIMDSFKLALSKSKLIPFITIPLYQYYEDNDIYEIVKKAISEINVRKALPAYCTCGAKLQMRQNSETKAHFYFCPICKRTDSNKSKTYSLNDFPLLI